MEKIEKEKKTEKTKKNLSKTWKVEKIFFDNDCLSFSSYVFFFFFQLILKPFGSAGRKGTFVVASGSLEFRFNVASESLEFLFIVARGPFEESLLLRLSTVKKNK